MSSSNIFFVLCVSLFLWEIFFESGVQLGKRFDTVFSASFVFQINFLFHCIRDLLLQMQIYLTPHRFWSPHWCAGFSQNFVLSRFQSLVHPQKFFMPKIFKESESIAFRETKFKRALRVHFLTHFTKTFCRFLTPKVNSGTDMISPSIEISDFLFWHKKNFESDFWKFCGKQTKYISRVQI